MAVMVSPNYRNVDFPGPLTLDDKITLFEDRIIGWQLDIANSCINGVKDTKGNTIFAPLHGAGLATLSIVLSYFEMIAKYQEGYQDKFKSKDFFKKGVHAVFPNLVNNPKVIVDKLLDSMYYGARCGLYHSSIILSKIYLTGNFTSSIGYDSDTSVLTINPHLLVPELKNHFSNYIRDLKNPINHQLRQNFELRFDYEATQ